MNIAGSKVFQNLAKLQEVPDEVNQIFFIQSSTYVMVWFHFKESGQVSSAILPTCKVMK